VTSDASLAWLDTLPGVRAGEPLARHTTYRIGGPAERYLETADAGAAAGVVAGCVAHGIPMLALGNGSNLLVADAGVEGLVIRLTDTTINVAGSRLVAAGGGRMVKVAQAAERSGLAGMEWALGIPGSAGGSAYNNAGCFGSDMAATVANVDLIMPTGARRQVSNAECAFRYRGSSLRDGALQGSLVLAVTFALEPGDPAAIKARMAAVQAERHQTQPVSGRSTGSVFKNPPGDFAGRLVEAAGLKGTRVGGAMVSREHANFIVNAGGATASDVAELVRLVRTAVRDQTGVELELEMEAVGRWPAGVLP
jgi:UDP-N-acetylmuramate dehydrogenase